MEWQDFYNHYRVHGSLKNLRPWERWKELELKTPLYEDADAMFDESKERIKLQNYWADLQQAKAHKSKKKDKSKRRLRPPLDRRIPGQINWSANLADILYLRIIKNRCDY